MKRSLLIKTESGSFRAVPQEHLSDASGVAANLGSFGVSSWVAIDAEDLLIQSIDEQKMSREKILASRFLQFLSDRRLTMELLKQLSIDEQNRLKKEFLGE